VDQRSDSGMAKRLKLAERWKADRLEYVGYPMTAANEAIMQLTYYLGARAALDCLAPGSLRTIADRDKSRAALQKEVMQFLLAAGLHD
jgi:hypothetical protein